MPATVPTTNGAAVTSVPDPSTTPPSTTPPSSAPTTSAPESGASESGAPATSAPELAEPTAQRIIVSDQAILDAALALDLPVVAIPGYEDREAIPDYLAERAAGVEVLAERTEINLESLAAAQPDLLLFSAKLVEASGVRDQLSQIAELAELEVSTARPWRDSLRDVAAAVGVPERAEAAIADVEARIEAGRSAIAASGSDVEVSVVRCFGTSCRYLPGGSSFPGQVLDELGVARPALQASDPEGRAFVEVSPERVDLLAGDLIVVFGTDAEDTIEQLQDNPLWLQLEAVQAGRVHPVDDAAWFTGSALAVEVIVDEMVELLR